MKHYKINKKKKAIKTRYIFIIIIIILLFTSISYSKWSTQLNINGSITGEYKAPDLPVIIDPKDDTSTGESNRFTANTKMEVLGTEIYKVVGDSYEGNTITTTIKHVYKKVTSWWNPSPTFTLTIPNNNSTDFTEGQIELLEKQDSNSILSNLNYNVASEIMAGSTGDVTISATLAANKNVANNTYYKFAISYKLGEVRYYFYYNIIILPIS